MAELLVVAGGLLAAILLVGAVLYLLGRVLDVDLDAGAERGETIVENGRDE